MSYSPVTRLLTTLDLLQSRPGVTAAQLAERLAVEARSVRRYITMLQDIGIPVEAVRGRYGGYRLRPGFTPPANFDCLAYTIQAFAAIPSHWLAEVLLQTSLEQIREAVPATFATLEQTPAGLLLRAYDDDLQHTARFLINLGCPFRVLQPPELVEVLRRLAESILDFTKADEKGFSSAL